MSLQVDACFAHVSAGLSLPSRSHGILVRRDEGRQGGQSLGVGGRGGVESHLGSAGRAQQSRPVSESAGRLGGNSRTRGACKLQKVT